MKRSIQGFRGSSGTLAGSDSLPGAPMSNPTQRPRLTFATLALLGTAALASAQGSQALTPASDGPGSPDMGHRDPAGRQAAEDVDFLEDIEPLLSNGCYRCHGPEKQKAGVRFDTREGLFEGDEGFLPVVPGDPAASTIIERVSLPHGDPDIMPPEGKGDPLSEDQVALLSRWIEEGAPWEAPAPTKSTPAPTEGPAAWVLAPLDEATAERVQVAVDAYGELGVQVLPLHQGTHALEANLGLLRDKLTDRELNHLGGLAPSLVWLSLARTAVTDSGLDWVAACQELRSLNLSNTAITGAGLARLAGLKRLEVLNLYGTRVDDASLAHLGGMTSLRKLYLWQSAVTPEGAAALKERFPALSIDLGVQPEPDEGTPPEEVAMVLNDVCPVNGEAVDVTKTIEVDGFLIAFCCDTCKGAYPKVADAQAKVRAWIEEAQEEARGAIPVNATCPVSGTDVDPEHSVEFEGQLVGFCCPNCKAKFEADPAAFRDKIEGLQAPESVALRVEDAIRATCIFSGKPIQADSLTLYRGKVVGFCNPHCRDDFAAEPEEFLALIPELDDR